MAATAHGTRPARALSRSIQAAFGKRAWQGGRRLTTYRARVLTQARRVSLMQLQRVDGDDMMGKCG